jgi:TonB family protein
VRFRLSRTGAVSDVDVEVVSGAPGLDSSARRAVDRAQPFPPLPDGYGEDIVEIAVRFTVSEGR